MLEQLASPRQQPAHRIHLLDRAEVRRCCDRWRCTEHELRSAVYAVGSQPENVEAYFHPPLTERLARAWKQLWPAARPLA